MRETLQGGAERKEDVEKKGEVKEVMRRDKGGREGRKEEDKGKERLAKTKRKKKDERKVEGGKEGRKDEEKGEDK